VVGAGWLVAGGGDGWGDGGVGAGWLVAGGGDGAGACGAGGVAAGCPLPVGRGVVLTGCAGADAAGGATARAISAGAGFDGLRTARGRGAFGLGRAAAGVICGRILGAELIPGWAASCGRCLAVKANSADAATRCDAPRRGKPTTTTAAAAIAASLAEDAAVRLWRRWGAACGRGRPRRGASGDLRCRSCIATRLETACGSPCDPACRYQRSAPDRSPRASRSTPRLSAAPACEASAARRYAAAAVSVSPRSSSSSPKLNLSSALRSRP
jgi:hypothetical protein